MRGGRPYLYLAPALMSMAALTFFPVAYTIYVAFTNYDLYHFRSYQFVGFANFTSILAGQYTSVVLPVFAWTLAFAVLTTVLNYSVGLGLAIMLNNPLLKESVVYRTLLIIPWGLPSTLGILAWSGLLNQTFGQVNALLHVFGIAPVPWLTNATWAKVSILVVSLWFGYPFFMTATLGGLQSIPSEVYEAAALDGAVGWSRVRWITFPLLFQFSIPLLIGSFAYNFNNFGVVYLLTGGGPPRADTPFAGSTDVLSTFIYNLTLNFNRYELAATMGILLFIIVGGLSLVQMRLTGSFREAT